MKKMPWKNGGGVTMEIAIFPETAQLDLLNFDWRVSIVAIDTDGPFSQFPNYDRQLVVWSGEALEINGISRPPLQVLEFSGEQKAEAKLAAGAVKDFGVIFKRGCVNSKMEVLALVEEERLQKEINGVCFVLCARGELRVGEFYLNPGDVIHAAGAGNLVITALERANLVIVQLRTTGKP